MSTPAAQALSSAAAAAAPSQGSAPGAVAPSAPAAPASAPGAPGAGAAPFWDSLLPASEPTTKEAREWLSAKGFKDPVALVTSYRDTERMANDLRSAAALKAYPTETVNPDGTVKPPDENQVKAWRASMGVPATPADYKLEVPANAAYPQFSTYLSEVLHEAGVPAGMAPKLAQGYEKAVAKLETELRAAEDAKSAAALKQLEQEWGANYQERLSLGQRGQAWLFKQVGGLDDTQLRVLESVIGTDKWMRMMYQFGAGNREAGFASNGGNPQFDGGVSEAQAKYAALQAQRAAGQISTEDYRKQERALADMIAGGFAAAN